MSGWKCIEIGEVAGDVGCFTTFVAFHGSHGVRSVGENAMSRRNWDYMQESQRSKWRKWSEGG